MKHNTRTAILLLIACFSEPLAAQTSSLPQQQSKAQPQLIWSSCDTCAQPESAYFDPGSKKIYVSNVAGSPIERDAKGWIQ